MCGQFQGFFSTQISSRNCRECKLVIEKVEADQRPEAVAAFQRAVACDPRYTDADFRMGIALEKLGDLRGAIFAYNGATELLPSLSEAWFRAGALVYSLGHRKAAIGCFRRTAATGRNSRFGRPRRGCC
jgi:tetratricopeptide (TPR) repeat protein